MFMSVAKMAELIKMPFAGLTQVRPRNHVLERGSRSPKEKGKFLEVVCPIEKQGNRCLLHPAHIDRQILTIYMSHDVLPHKEISILDCINTAPILGVKYSQNPNFGGVNRNFKPNMQYIKTCILFKLLHQIQPNSAQ